MLIVWSQECQRLLHFNQRDGQHVVYDELGEQHRDFLLTRIAARMLQSSAERQQRRLFSSARRPRINDARMHRVQVMHQRRRTIALRVR